jgi:hypothetical protein
MNRRFTRGTQRTWSFTRGTTVRRERPREFCAWGSPLFRRLCAHVSQAKCVLVFTLSESIYSKVKAFTLHETIRRTVKVVDKENQRHLPA